MVLQGLANHQTKACTLLGCFPGLWSRGHQSSCVPHLANVGGCQHPQLGCVHFILEPVRSGGWAQPEDPGIAGRVGHARCRSVYPHSPDEETEGSLAGAGRI